MCVVVWEREAVNGFLRLAVNNANTQPKYIVDGNLGFSLHENACYPPDAIDRHFSSWYRSYGKCLSLDPYRLIAVHIPLWIALTTYV